MRVPLMLKYFCITLLCLAVSTQKTLLILAWNIVAWVCAMTDRLVSSGCLPQPPPGLGVRMRLSCCTGDGGAREGACSCLSTAGSSVAGTECPRPPGSEDKRTEVLKPSSQPQAPQPAASASSARALVALRLSLSSPLDLHNGLFFLWLIREKSCCLRGTFCQQLPVLSSLCRACISGVLK